MTSRRDKLDKIRAEGIAFPNTFRRIATSRQIHDFCRSKSRRELEEMCAESSLAGRIVRKRTIGKISFINIQDHGGQIQLYARSDNLQNGCSYDAVKRYDLGDIIGVRGKLFRTLTGELSIYCNELFLVTKSVRPLPNKFHGLSDQEIRYRRRYLDLLANSRSRNIFLARSYVLSEIRNFMAERNFLEVETPMMHGLPGGAVANPFVTNYDALDMRMYLRVSPELYLKQLVVGGFERVFEINRSFRNEGISSRHSPEFTMMELYMAYADHHDLITLTEELLCSISRKMIEREEFSCNEDLADVRRPFSRMTMKEAICLYYPRLDLDKLEDVSTLLDTSKSLGIRADESWELGKIQAKIFEKVAQHQIVEPTFVTSFPVAVSPLARRSDDDQDTAERFEFFANGMEIGNGFSELNDPDDQLVRFRQQCRSGDEPRYDADYITALEHGLPPTAGLGVGIDRLMMFLTKSNTIRDVILFPVLRRAD